jgi:hypothetical protein
MVPNAQTPVLRIPKTCVLCEARASRFQVMANFPMAELEAYSSRWLRARSPKQRPTAIATFAFVADPKEPKELSVAANELLAIVDMQPAGAEGWLLARNDFGRQGLVPAAYVRCWACCV